ncbi:radical SAM protein [Nonomuraea sp. NEAU-A123]|uniref:B12-binding domain-containing radical SAM protein n=1 Tax=Nonomuraea sp. NEAU-A123 TaxID=2839649 RepID=UPI001BE4567F|nr:radical SAM protein [Nonomuraea sp. NEAU-A123]MBT2226599.1 radical SAM protein [Nonomuraea sp. NEAU-A123]
MPFGQEAGGEGVDVLLIFPPQTEARFFPYLSLPYLSGHLRRRGRRVHQADLNIALLHDLLGHPELLGDVVRDQPDSGAGAWYRRAMADVVAGYVDELRAHVLRKEPPGELGPARAVRLAHHAIELLVRDTFLVRTWRDLAQLDGAAQQAALLPPAASGMPIERLYGMVEALLVRHRPRVVGLSVAFFSQLAPALLIAAWVRRLRPDAKICLGGQQVMIRHEELARLPGVRAAVDALCWTAGEQPLERWLDALDGNAPEDAVPGMIWLPRAAPARRSEQPVTLRFHDLGPPDFSGLPVRSYLNETMEVAIISCVGCYWGRCAFCSYGNRSLAPGAYQQGTVRQIADAVQAVVRDTGAEFVSISDENTNLRLIVKAMREVRDRGVKVGFGVRSRLDATLADPAFCRSLAEVGCELMSVGYEGTSQRLLDLMDRGVRAADYQRIVENVASVGIVLRFSVMGYVFDETDAEFEESLRFLAANQERIGIDALELMVSEPGSRLARDPDGFGLSLDTSGALAGNPELSYLSGRVGHPLTVLDGPTRAQALDRLVRVFHTVRPGKATAILPRRTASSAGSRVAAVRAVKPYPWVRTVPARVDVAGFPDAKGRDTGAAANGTKDAGGDGRIVLADLVWERFYALPRRDVEQRADGLLEARTAHGRRLLASLVEVTAGTDQTGAVRWEAPAVAGGEAVRRPT